MQGSFVPDSRLAMEVGWETLPGFVWGECQSRGNMPAQNPVPFWLQRVSLFRWFNLTTVSLPSSAYPCPSLLAASPGQASRLSAFIPASRIEDQSLPWGMCINPSPRTVGMTPTPESSSQVLSGLSCQPGANPPSLWKTRFLTNESHLHCVVRPGWARVWDRRLQGKVQATCGWTSSSSLAPSTSRAFSTS